MKDSPQAKATVQSNATDHPIILYDGVCGLCNRLNQFVLRRDPGGIFRFVSLQSPLAAQILDRHQKDPADLDTLYIVIHFDQPGESLLDRSDAAIFALKQIGGGWRIASSLAGLFPKTLRNFAYRLIARNRYRIFGRYETCMMPSPEYRARFLDV